MRVITAGQLSRAVRSSFDADAERSEEEKSDNQASFDADAERSEEPRQEGKPVVKVHHRNCGTMTPA